MTVENIPPNESESKSYDTAYCSASRDRWGTIWIGSDGRMNGVDSPAQLRKPEEVTALIAWLQKQIPAGNDQGPADAMRLALAALDDLIAFSGRCHDPDAECVLQDVHKPHDEVQVARRALVAALTGPRLSRDDGKLTLLQLVDQFGLDTIQKWLRNIQGGSRE
jgi:hypothetical protein